MYNNNNSSNSIDKTVKNVKLVLLGNSAAGKTCMVQRITYNTFNVNSSPTIGAAYTIYSVEKNIKVEIWDTAGQERFNSLLPMYARCAEIIIIVIDIEKNVDDQFLKWNKYIQDNEKLFSSYFKLLLIFNKYDLNSSFEVPGYILKDERFFFITLVSAKNGHNIDKLKTHLDLTAKKIIDEHARMSHEFVNMRRSSPGINKGINGGSGSRGDGDSNIENNDNDTIGSSSFLNMKINLDILEYREKMKLYYENSRC